MLPVIVYRDLNDVIARANAFEVGLGASVWGSDLKQAEQVAAKIDAGVTRVNAGCAHPQSPFGGFKLSGIGREGGLWSLHAFTEPQVISVAR